VSKGERFAPVFRAKRDKHANDDPQRFVKTNTAANGTANARKSIQQRFSNG